ncbi:uncharacterized protein LOC135812535 [Sycon ciliatum]|uniref:uncharacterized protein LOC135812535 n=1 Tax=Sycon ciliatum TaxID=27933 RepID=UPI0031F6B1FA
MAGRYILTAFLMTILGVSLGSSVRCEPCIWGSTTHVYSRSEDDALHLIASYDDGAALYAPGNGYYTKTFSLPRCHIDIIGLSLQVKGVCKLGISMHSSQLETMDAELIVSQPGTSYTKRICAFFTPPINLMNVPYPSTLLVNVTNNVSGGQCSVYPTRNSIMTGAFFLHLNYTDECMRPQAKHLEISTCTNTSFLNTGRLANGSRGTTSLPSSIHGEFGPSDPITDDTGMNATQNVEASTNSASIPPEKQPKESGSSLATAVGAVIGFMSVFVLAAVLYVLWRRHSKHRLRGDAVERQDVPLPRRPSTPENLDRTATLYSAVGPGHGILQAHVSNASPDHDGSMQPESAVYATVSEEPTGASCKLVGQRIHATPPTPFESRDQEEPHDESSIATDVYAMPQNTKKEPQYTEPKKNARVKITATNCSCEDAATSAESTGSDLGGPIPVRTSDIQGSAEVEDTDDDGI